MLEATRLSVETVVVDDASRDGGAELVESAFAWVRVVRRDVNGGFGAACNTGAAAARAPHVFFLNSDARPHAAVLEPLVEALATRDDAFAAMATNLSPSGEVLRPTQVTLNVDGLLRTRALTTVRHETLLACGAVPTLYGSGTALLVRKDRFHALDGFDPVFGPFYYEDVDLGWRAWHRGWSSWLVPEASVEHEPGTTIRRSAPAATVGRLRKRNRFLVVWRNLLDPWMLWTRHVPRIPARLLGRALHADPSPWRGLAAAVPLIGAVRRFRAEERRRLRCTDHEIVARLARARARVEERWARARPPTVRPRTT